MKAAVVAKDRSQRAVVVAGRAGLRFFNDLIPAAMTKFRPGYEFSRTEGTELHENYFVV